MSTEEPTAASDSSMVGETPLAAIEVYVSQDTNLTFEQLYHDEYRQVLGLAYVLTGSRWVAEELTQEAFAAAFVKWSVVSQYGAPGAWVRRVLCNRAASRVRRRVREAKAMLRLGGSRQKEFTLDESNFEFWQAVRKLPPRQAQCIALFYLEDMSTTAIAAVLGCSDGSVKTHLSRAREAIADELDTEEQLSNE